MKQNKNELDVDCIGGLGPLTKEEEKASISYAILQIPPTKSPHFFLLIVLLYRLHLISEDSLNEDEYDLYSQLL